MFIARNRETGQRIDITQYSDPKLELSNAVCVCPFCDSQLIIRDGPVRTAHFAHRSIECDSSLIRHPESIEHHEGKRFVANYLQEQFADLLEEINIQFEVHIKEANRIADVLIQFPMGWRVAHEIQLSPISRNQLQERTEDYARSGIDTIWWLGRKADNADNRAWCIEKFGCTYTINFTASNQNETIYPKPD